MTEENDPLGFDRGPGNDPLFIPKADPSMGWTINPSNPYGWLVVIAILALAAAPVVFAFLMVRSHLH